MERGLATGGGFWTVDDEGAPDYMDEDRIDRSLGGMAVGGDVRGAGGGGDRSDQRMQGRPKR